MDPLTDSQRRAAVTAFLARVDDGKGLQPSAIPLPYDPVPGIATARWPLFVAEELIADELRELTNRLNHWRGNLRRWHAWNEVLASYETKDRWQAEWGWVEPIAFYCMFQPSASRERFVLLATNSLHQIRMALDPAIVDELLGDPAAPDKCSYFPRPRDKERQLKSFAKVWPAGRAFIQALGQLDDHGYRALTGDFRNRASHGIAPRFSVGITSTVSRTRAQATKMEQQPDGTFEPVPVPGKLSTSYGYGGRSPLSMEDTWQANLTQFERACRAFDTYVALLTEAVAAIPRRPEPPPKT